MYHMASNFTVYRDTLRDKLKIYHMANKFTIHRYALRNLI